MKSGNQDNSDPLHPHNNRIPLPDQADERSIDVERERVEAELHLNRWKSERTGQKFGKELRVN